MAISAWRLSSRCHRASDATVRDRHLAPSNGKLRRHPMGCRICRTGISISIQVESLFPRALVGARAAGLAVCSARRCSPPAAPTTIADASHHAGSFALGGRHREGRTCCWWQADLQGDIARCQWHGIEGRWLRVDVVGSGRGHRAATDKAPAASVMATAAAPVGIFATT